MLLTLLQDLQLGEAFDMHARQIIRDRVKTVLTGLTTTGSNVYTNRIYPLHEDNMPALNITTPIDELEERLGTDKELRSLSVNIEISVKATDSAGDTLDDICEEVETALADDSTLGIGVEYSHFVTTEIETTDDEDQPIAQAQLTWKVLYVVNRKTVSAIEG